MTTSKIELKLCPFCGTAPELGGDDPGFESVSCPGCWAEGPWADAPETHQAVEKWNTRQSNEPPNEVLDALMEMFEHYCGSRETTADGRPMFDHVCMSPGENAADVLLKYGRITMDQLVHL